jgi:hypothetical protein
MPGLVGGFLRRGQNVKVRSYISNDNEQIYTDYLLNFKKSRTGSKLNTAVSPNEVRLLGSAKWENSEGTNLCLSTLLNLATNKSLT